MRFSFGPVTLVNIILLFLASVTNLPAKDADKNQMTFKEGFKFIQKHCVDCHEPENKEGNLDLTRFKTIKQIVDEYPQWNKVITRVQSSEMPPEESEQPDKKERELFIKWLTESMHHEICDDGIAPGPPILRRMNRNEYANTIRDLLGIHVNAGSALPADGAGGEGFDNAAETLFISPIHAEKYLEAANTALQHAMKDPHGRKRIITATPNKKLSAYSAAKEVLTKFLPKAFRRPVTKTEINAFLKLFKSAYRQDKSFESSLQLVLQGVLISPRFLFLWEQPNKKPKPVPVDNFELANKLSYFLWESMPDQKLFQLATQGKLTDPSVLQNEAIRMLTIQQKRGDIRRSSKIRDFVESFVEQWLGTRALGREFQPDTKVVKGYDSELEGGMKYEPVFFFEEILIENRSLLNLIDSDFTFTNKRLAKHYKIKGEFREQPKFVKLEKENRRGGILSMASVLAVSSYPHRTSPVLRGKYVMDTLLGTPPPPPPPNVPLLTENEKGATPKTLRERLEKHREDAICASCHDMMDPLGFGLENYDVLGRWRTKVDGQPIDSRGILPDKTEFTGPDELKNILLKRKKQIIRHLTTKMLGYALARGLTNEDYCTVDKIVDDLEKDDYKSHTLIKGIIMSTPFRFKAPKASTKIRRKSKQEN